jgi:HAD superfamily hydrolase (TIGR01549 family)
VIKAVIFDCFGVVISDALSVMCTELQPTNPDGVVEVWGLINKANRGILTSEESSTRIAELFGMTLVEYRTKIAEGETKNQQLLNYISDLHELYKTAMLSNIPVGGIARRFDEGELEQYFDVVVVSGETGYAKPSPEAYDVTAERLGVRPSECVFVDDREQYVLGARAVGMHPILYKDFAQFRMELEVLFANS